MKLFAAEAVTGMQEPVGHVAAGYVTMSCQVAAAPQPDLQWISSRINISPRMGAMDFVKFKGCGGCHRDTPEYGGFSGPELYTAWNRLQPEFIVSYIKDPSAWEPFSLMLNKELQDPQIHKLANYLKVIAEQEDQR